MFSSVKLFDSKRFTLGDLCMSRTRSMVLRLVRKWRKSWNLGDVFESLF